MTVSEIAALESPVPVGSMAAPRSGRLRAITALLVLSALCLQIAVAILAPPKRADVTLQRQPSTSETAPVQNTNGC